MRAMILAAGLGTRMGSLAPLCAKPALPVRGVPVIARLMQGLVSQGVREVVVNLHHRPESVRTAVDEWRPEGLRVHFSEEAEPLGTGGGIAHAGALLRGSEEVLVLPGDMLLELDLARVVEAHRASGRHVTLVLRDDPRAASFGSLGLDAAGRLRRIGVSHDFGGESTNGVFVGLRVLSPQALEWIAEHEGPSEDLRDVFAPRIAAGEPGIGGLRLAGAECAWEPVGNPREYLAANFPEDPRWHALDGQARARGTQIEATCIIGPGAHVAPDCRLERIVVWPRERVAPGTEARDGVFAGGRFHDCSPSDVMVEAAVADGTATASETGEPRS